MRITDIKTFVVGPRRHRGGPVLGKNWLFVKVETGKGPVGWGEAYTTSDRERVVADQVEALRPYLLGRNPFHIKQLTTMIERDYAIRRNALELRCATSAIEQACWDIVGKVAGQPVYMLLGGPMRAKIRVYANGWSGGNLTPAELGRRAAATVEKGFRALKFDPFPGRWRRYIDREAERMAVERVRAVREAVGPDVDILIEVHRRLAPMHAIRVAHQMAEFAPFWYEEPVVASNVPALAEVRRQIPIPVVTGETLYCKADFRPVFEQRAADIINPDVCCCGILELKEIAAMAEPYMVAFAPHNYNSTTLGLASTLQVAACSPNFIIAEFFVNHHQAETTADILATPPFAVEDGTIDLPTAPGLGQSLDEAALGRWASGASPVRRFPTADEEG
jgi:galactonate dehydratase